LSKEEYHTIIPTVANYVSVILPIAIPKLYTYFVPPELTEMVQFGIRIEVVFGKSKRYAALVVDLHDEPPIEYKAKSLTSIIDEKPIITALQYNLWQWVAKYYCCSLGEVMNAALPGNLKLTSETLVTLSPIYDPNYQGLKDAEFMV